MGHELKEVIKRCDEAIKREDFDTLLHAIDNSYGTDLINSI